jgi:dipeptidyl aminopeptidase/acylaminoacyl peptidase
MQQAMKKAGKSPKLIVFKDAGHNFLASNLEAYLTQLEQFFAAHLPQP